MKSKKFLKWIETKIKDHEVEILENDIFPLSGLTDLQATIRINNETFVGHGTDKDEDVALQKATCEAIERAITYDVSIYPTSNGIAGHFNHEQTQKNAKKELIERDAFLFHFISNTPPTQIIETSNFYQQIKDAFSNISFKSYKLDCDKSHNVILTLAEVGSDGIIISLGCDNILERALDNSLVQVARKVHHTHLNGIPIKNSSTINTVEDHFIYGFTAEGKEHFFGMINATKTGFKNNLFANDIKTIRLIPKCQYLKKLIDDAGLLFCKAHSLNAQELFFGQPTIDKINTSKFKSILKGREVCPPLYPHIFA